MVFSCLYRCLVPVSLPVAVSMMQLCCTPVDAGPVRIKDITSIRNHQEVDLIGYGLVIGLEGTGDGTGTRFTVQSLVNMMQRMGLTVEADKVKVKNVAAAVVTAKLTSYLSAGSYVDVTVSSIGDASSLQGGTLLMTPLSSADGIVHVVAQGPISIGGFNVQVDEANKIVNNYTLVGRVPNGGKITRAVAEPQTESRELILSLLSPDYTTAYRIAERINLKYGLTALPVDGGTVKVMVPDSLLHPAQRVKFVADVGQLEVIPDQVARVVINEKTGTIVAGEHVTIAPVAIAHGTITVNIQSRPVISQPEAFSQGETVVTRESWLEVKDEEARVVHLPETVYLSDVAKALNQIGATPRDIIAIFQAIKQAGALRSELVIL